MSVFKFLKRKKKAEAINRGDTLEEALAKKAVKNEEAIESIEEETIQETKGEELKMQESPLVMEPVESKKRTKEECIQEVKEYCVQIAEGEKQLQTLKVEYQSVTEYLADIQKIDRTSEKEKTSLHESARQMLTLERERSEYQKKEVRTSNPRFRGIVRYEEEMLQELKKMRENEDYLRIIQNDMRNLEAEKAALLYEKNDSAEKQVDLKKILLVTCAIVGSLFLLFFILDLGLQLDMSIPYLMTVTMAMLIAGYVFWEARRNKYQNLMSEKKLNRAIKLLNQVKIKYVNQKNALEYGYRKLGVKNSMELEYLWNEYLKAKEEERTYQSNTDRLNYYRTQLLDTLEMLQVKNCEIWLTQATAFCDMEEMNTIRKELEERRQKMREKIDYHGKRRETAFEKIYKIIEERNDMKETVIACFEKYGIAIEKSLTL